MILLQRGVIHDGCEITAKGIVRVKGEEVCIESMHNLVSVDGKTLADLCDPTGVSRTEQGQIVTPQQEDVSSWKKKAKDLEKENESLSKSLKEAQKTISTLQEKIHLEHSMRTTFQDQLTKEQRTSQDAVATMLEAKAKLAEKVAQVETLQAQLDSMELLMAERRGKLRASQEELALARQTAGHLQSKVSVLDENLIVEKQQTSAILTEIHHLKVEKEEELESLKQELEHNRTTITTLKNELEIASLEEREYQTTIEHLQKEIDTLRKDLDRTVHPQEPTKNKSPSRKLLKQGSLKKLIGSMKTKKSPTATPTPTPTETPLPVVAPASN